jgi:hypothetical protein
VVVVVIVVVLELMLAVMMVAGQTLVFGVVAWQFHGKSNRVGD